MFTVVSMLIVINSVEAMEGLIDMTTSIYERDNKLEIQLNLCALLCFVCL